jgi:hypothetical protein
MRARPAGVLGPVDLLRWKRQRALPRSALTWQRPPALVLARKGADRYDALAMAGGMATPFFGSLSKTPTLISVRNISVTWSVLRPAVLAR